MSNGKNSYEKKAKKKAILSGTPGTASDKKLPMKERAKKTIIPTLVNTASAIGGGFAGAAMGRLSFLTGLVVTGAGEIMGSPAVASFGLGMAVSNVYSMTTAVNGTEPTSKMEAAKERMKHYGKGIMQKLYLDKLIKKKESEQKTTTAQTSTTTTTANTNTTTNTGTSGMGEVQYFKYPLSEKPDQMDLSELERFEKEIQESAENFAQENKSVQGTEENFHQEINKENLIGLDEEEKIY
ncbi:MAG TPA: hypothetical protein VK177_14855 [Flavobacteriales bacterium]|nr:hypothetical protein [Flavobacteriales bacterium]